MPPTRLLTFTTLYPHAGLPNQGVFVENRLRHLVATGLAESTVVAPVPWFPSASPRFGTWSRFAAARPSETRHTLHVQHPRYPVIPKIGTPAAPALLYAASIAPVARALRAQAAQGRPVDLIDAHYLYPDGVAAIMLGRRFRLPVVMTARGSDVTQLPDHALPRRMIQWAMAHADAMISVSAGLKRAMIELGADPARITVLRNGVDLQTFTPPADRDALRHDLALQGPTLLSVGHLIPRKGHDLAIAALPHLPEWTLLVVGEGPERANLAALATRLGVAPRVRLLGAHPHAELPRFYGAADLLVLASSREGWANVLLESMACGTPVIASPIPGNDEVVQRRQAGLIAHERSGEAIATAIHDLWSNPPPRPAVRAYAEEFSWDATSQGQSEVFATALRRHAERSGPRP